VSYLNQAQEEFIAKLRAGFPDWEFWVVHRATDGPVWCARLRSDRKAVLNGYSPDELAEYISDRSLAGGGG
jgi:hypothetical protein